MAKRQTRKQFDNLFHAALEGAVEDVRHLLADGTHPDDRNEWEDPSPLMAAAARGRLDVVEVLVNAGADVNAEADDQSGELDQFPYLDGLLEAGRLTAITALAYAALYGQEQIYQFLAPRTAPHLRGEAAAILRARAEHPDFVPRPYLAPEKPKSASQAAREELLAHSGAARRWVVQCGLCHKQGYKPSMPAEIDRRGTAARVRRLFRPLALENYLCPRCGDRIAKAHQKMAEAQARRRLANQLPHGGLGKFRHD
jgi:hypothetical protein